MSGSHRDQRKEERFPVHAGTTLAINNDADVANAVTVNMNSSGVLVHFDEPIQLVPGDRVTCDFVVSHDPDRPFPNWGVGTIVRVDGSCAAIDLTAAGFYELKPTRNSQAGAPNDPLVSGH